MKPSIATQFGPWALVTGASSGIGEQFARQLAQEGLNVVLVARRRPLLEALGKELSQRHGVQVRVVEADLSQANALTLVAEATADLDIGLLINNAGTGKPARFLDLEPAEILAMNQLNALAGLGLTHHFGRRFRQRGRGGIVLSGVMGGTDGLPFMASMAASKAFVASLGQGLIDEFKDSGIVLTVLSVTPTDTPIFDKLGFRESTLPLPPLTTAQCVRETLTALRAHRRSVMAGLRFRLMHALLPVGLQRTVMGQMLKRNNRLA